MEMTPKIFLKNIEENIQLARLKVPSLDLAGIELDRPFFIPIHQLLPGQTRFSLQRVLQKCQNYQNYQNYIDQEDSEKALLTPFGPLLLDGHHRFLVSVFLGCTTFPIQITENCSMLDAEKIFSHLKVKKRIYYPKNQLSPIAFHQMEDSPNRYLASLIAFKPKNNFSQNSLTAWVKDQESPPFIEFVIGDLLQNYGIYYKESWGKNVPKLIVEISKKIIQFERAKGHPVLQDISLSGELQNPSFHNSIFKMTLPRGSH